MMRPTCANSHYSKIPSEQVSNLGTIAHASHTQCRRDNPDMCLQLMDVALQI